jgi:hypothetical protein
MWLKFCLLQAHLEIQWTNQSDKCGSYKKNVGRDNSVSVATQYGLGGPGIGSRWG